MNDTKPIPHILVCTPAYGGNMCFEYVVSLLSLERACREKGYVIDYSFVAQESLIPRARNYLCGEFLKKKEFTHLFFIDADIHFHASDVIRMIEADVSFIGGVYPKKKIHWDRINSFSNKNMAPLLDYVVAPLENVSTVNDPQKPHPVKFVGTGLLLIKRHVLEDVIASDPNNWYSAENEKCYKFFDCIVKDGVYLSEDYYFCDTYQKIGGTVYAAYWTHCTHWGIQGFSGNILAMS